VEKDEYGSDGPRMPREEEIDSYGEIGVLYCGKRFRYSKKENVAEREDKHRVFEKRDPCVVFQITPYGERKEKEKDPQCGPTEEGSPSHIRIYVEPTTSCASLRSEVETETLSREIVVSGGSQNSSQNSGSSTVNQIQSTSPKVSTTQNTMVGIYNTLRIPELQGEGSKDP
jgi:hypothetical protein